MQIIINIDGKAKFNMDDIKRRQEIGAYSWEGFSSFTVRYDSERDELYIEYGAEWPRMTIDGKDIKLF